MGRNRVEENNMMAPSAFACGPDDKIYLLDVDANDNSLPFRLRVYTDEGVLIYTASGAQMGGKDFIYPAGITVDGSGNVFISDTGTYRIQKFIPCENVIPTETPTLAPTPGITVCFENGAVLGEIGGFAGPSYIAENDSGNKFILEPFSGRILAFRNNDIFVTQWGERGEEQGQFMNPSGMDCDTEGNVYIADRGNNRVQVFDKNGVFLRSFNVKGDYNSEFDGPADVYCGSNYLLIADGGNARIIKTDLNGNILEYIGGTGWFNGGMVIPVSVCEGPDGLVYAADNEDKSITKFSADGQFITKWHLLKNEPESTAIITDIASDAQGKIYAALSDNTVRVCDGNGYLLDTITGNDSGYDNFEGLAGINIGKDGVLFAVETSGNRIRCYVPCGLLTPTPTPYPTPETAPCYEIAEMANNNQRLLAINAQSGSVYAAYENGKIIKFSKSLVFEKEFGGSGTEEGLFSIPSAIAIGNNGKVYITDTGNSRVQIFNPDCTFSGVLDGEFKNPAGICADAGGKIYVADTGNNQIKIFDGNGVLINSFGFMGLFNGQFLYPSKIAVDSEGYIYVAESGNKRISIFNQSGEYERSFSLAEGFAGYYAPLSLNFDNSGLLYISEKRDSEAGQIKIYDKYGSFVSVFETAGDNLAYPILSADENGRMITADMEKGIIMLVPCGTVPPPTPTATPMSGMDTCWKEISSNLLQYVNINEKPNDIDIGKNEMLYAAYCNKSTIIKIKPDLSAEKLELNGLVCPEKIAITDDYLIVSDSAAGNVKIFDNFGVLLNHIGVFAGGKTLQKPMGIAVNKSKLLYVSDYLLNEIVVCDLDGNHIKTIGSRGQLKGQFLQPSDIVFDNAGNLYILDSGNKRVQIFDNSDNYLYSFNVEADNLLSLILPTELL